MHWLVWSALLRKWLELAGACPLGDDGQPLGRELGAVLVPPDNLSSLRPWRRMLCDGYAQAESSHPKPDCRYCVQEGKDKSC